MKKHQGKIIDDYRNHQVIDCSRCGFAHLYPLPTKKILNQFYRKEFYQKTKPEYLTKTKKEQDYWQIIYQDRLEVFDQYIKKKKRRILDIGCSGGFFLKFFQDKGWEAIGIEPSPTASNYAKKQGLRVINAFLEDIPVSNLDKFDAINMSFVLEHLLNPIKICQICYRLLRKNGIMCVETPNDFNPLQQVVKKTLNKPSYWIAYPDHINYFTPNSLTKMIEHIGFRLLLREGTFPMELFLLMGKDYINNKKVGLKCHIKRMNLEKALSNTNANNLKRSLYQQLAQLNLGRETIQYFIKKT